MSVSCTLCVWLSTGGPSKTLSTMSLSVRPVKALSKSITRSQSFNGVNTYDKSRYPHTQSCKHSHKHFKKHNLAFKVYLQVCIVIINLVLFQELLSVYHSTKKKAEQSQ